MTFKNDFYDRISALRSNPPFQFPQNAIPPEFRRAAVLIPFWADENDIYVLLTRRSRNLSQHKGETAFPGGRLEPGESWTEGALREANEEVGIAPEAVEVLGELDDAWSGAGHHIRPIVGWLKARPELRANPAEVSELLIASVTELLRPNARSEETITRNGNQYTNTTLSWTGGDAYGLSADLLLEALEWGLGQQPARGETRGEARLKDLRTYFPLQSRGVSNRRDSSR